ACTVPPPPLRAHPTSPLFPYTTLFRSPDMPDRIGVVTPTSGPGQSLEGAADTVGFQMRIRGAQNNPGDAETLAYDADGRILGAQDRKSTRLNSSHQISSYAVLCWKNKS